MHDVELVPGVALINKLFRTHDTVNWVVVALFVSVTVPVKPFTAVTVIVEVADWPKLTFAGKPAVIVKSTNVNVTVVTRVSAGVVLVPVTVTVKVPAVVELHDTVAVAGDGGKDTLLGVIRQVNAAGSGASDNETDPEKPLNGVTVIVDVPVSPTFTALGDVAEIVQSGRFVNVKVAVVVCVREPLVPVIVTA